MVFVGMHHPLYRYLMFKMQKCKLFVAFCSDFCCASKLIIVEPFFKKFVSPCDVDHMARGHKGCQYVIYIYV